MILKKVYNLGTLNRNNVTIEPFKKKQPDRKLMQI